VDLDKLVDGLDAHESPLGERLVSSSASGRPESPFDEKWRCHSPTRRTEALERSAPDDLTLEVLDDA
jgi:hypothetical protein